MARPLRVEFPDVVYHITIRVNESKAIFRDDRDRKMFLDIFEDVTLRWIAKSQRFMNKPLLRDIFGTEVLMDRRKRDESIGKAVLGHGYTQREVSDHLEIHFTSVGRILRAKVEMPTK